MQITVDSREPLGSVADLLVVPLSEFDDAKPNLSGRARTIDGAMNGRLAAVLETGDFRGKPGQTLVLYPDGAIAARRVLLLGLGAEPALDTETLRRAAGSAVGQARRHRAKKLVFLVPRSRRVRVLAAAQALAEGAVLGSYRFDRYRKNGDDDTSVETEVVAFSIERAADLRAARAAARRGVILAESQNVARQLSNEPANVLPPAALAREAQRVAREVGLRSKVMGVTELKRREMGGLLAVGQGSANSPRLIVLEHNPPPRGKAAARRRQDTLCFVGKGITFDSGGISIKPSAGMDEMKHDMSGAAAVVGALRACALLKVPEHVVGIVAAAENLPSATAYRPGDVVTTMSGKTIEILNTDAEGRVVLADALHYARTEFSPRAMVDLATLTGACVVALGPWATGLFGTDERLVELVRNAGETTAERAWPLPLWSEHRKAVRSEVATVKNVAGRNAGSSTAAAFLATFVGDTPWVHLDIAGTGWTSKPGPYQPRGATGVGVRLLLEVLSNWKRSGIG